MKPIHVYRHPVTLLPDSSRVIIRPFIPGNPQAIARIIGRALALTEEEVTRELDDTHLEFDSRHLDIESLLMQQYTKVFPHIFTHRPLSRARQLLIGALFSGEYALESAALFNPSMVLHPDQSTVAAGGIRFIMSLRATGEGHISSIEFRSGSIAPDGIIQLDPISRFVTVPEVVPNPSYLRKSFILKLYEMGFRNEDLSSILIPLAEKFNRNELKARIATVRRENKIVSHELARTLECIQWLADSNYELRFPPNLALSERILFPNSRSESNGIEDARFVRFVEEDASVMYYATYTAYNGHTILPMWIETPDFLEFRVLTLNGSAVQNKGMALFPRRIGGHYFMLSRQDDENILLMVSDNLHYWNDPLLLLRPAEAWESFKIGNCGSPIETSEGWLVITHGVGPMRKYCIGAALLDLEDPSKVIGRLREPLLSPEGPEREGYVPNVVYSCGSLVHSNTLILPYAMSDKVTAFASIALDELLAALKG